MREQTGAQIAALVTANRYRRIQAGITRTLAAKAAGTPVRLTFADGTTETVQIVATRPILSALTQERSAQDRTVVTAEIVKLPEAK